MLRLPNGSYIGMLQEVRHGIVDISAAAFIWTLAREEFVDFTPGIFKTTFSAIIRKPSKKDISLRYFYDGMFLP